MSAYIDRDIARQYLHQACEALGGNGGIKLKIAFDELPDADVVEVVRCKDCEHCADDWNGNQPMFTCELAKCGESVQPNDYCSFGERREDEQIH